MHDHRSPGQIESWNARPPFRTTRRVPRKELQLVHLFLLMTKPTRSSVQTVNAREEKEHAAWSARADASWHIWQIWHTSTIIAQRCATYQPAPAALAPGVIIAVHALDVPVLHIGAYGDKGRSGINVVCTKATVQASLSCARSRLFMTPPFAGGSYGTHEESTRRP